MAPSLAVLITTCVRNLTHQLILTKCAESVRQHYPTADCIILNDSPPTTTITVPEGCNVYPAPHPNCGEVNAYVWACQHKDDYELFLFIHDSTFVLSPIDVTTLAPNHFRPLWWLNLNRGHIGGGCQGKEVHAIIDSFTVERKDEFLDLFTLAKQSKTELVFGGMALFSRAFCEDLVGRTNFLEVAPMFPSRPLRCFFERFIYLVAHHLNPIKEFGRLAYCGCIHRHGNPFRNTEYIPARAANPYVLKIWQGR